MKVSLVVKTAGKTVGQAIPVTLSQFIIGRDPQCNLRPASPVISKRHCAILVKNGKVAVRDFESTNGTFVNDQQIKGEVPLNHEDILKVGPLEFRVVIEKTTPVNKPTPPPTKAISAGNEEDVAAMLLSLQEDEETPSENSGSEDDAEIPGGSTVMDMVPLPPDTSTDAPKAPAKADAAPAAKAPAAKAPAAKAPAAKAPAAKAPAAKAPAAKAPAPPAAKAPAAPAPTPADTAADVPAPLSAASSAEIPAAKPGDKPSEKPAEKPGEKQGEKSGEKPQPQHATARDAARAILEKHFKRPRG